MSQGVSGKIPRALELEQRAHTGERLKNLGNDLFRQGKHKDAAVAYNDAVNANGTQPVYMSNLAATYLKLEDYGMAERAAMLALVHDPWMIKARFRRGLARKESNQLRAAKIDFETILREDPNCAEAEVELAAVLWLCAMAGESDDSDGSADYEYPPPDHPPRNPLPMWLFSEPEPHHIPEPEQEINGVEDSEHVGNGIPCKHHNRKPLGCAKGASCVYSHAPDARSMPDSEGRNVCLYFLLGECKHGERCIYSHSKANLPDLWDDDFRLSEVRELIYQNELLIKGRRLFSRYMGKGPLASEALQAEIRAAEKAKNPRARTAGTFLAMLQTMDTEPPPGRMTPFIMHLTLNKSTEIPRATVEGLRTHVEVSRAKTKAKALELLASPALRGVFITDAAIALERNAGLLRQLAAYARAGGTVVLGGSFKVFARNVQTDIADAQLAAFFREGWGVAWRVGPRRAGRSVTLNKRHKLAGAGGDLPGTYSMAGLHLNGVRVDDALHLHSDSAASELVETPVVFAKLGKGHLGFVGDGGAAESATTDIIAAMFGFSSQIT
ncbi:hypothetical protein B0H17DRAFT_1195665 [Mycena rosella]|uniref:C3H1-type domain-containing protein n=1 Tax=Mycena rosella TaxID=1033263 RepID=A0AAD7DYB5_MYCRO|nr:hypothetical protein B0H17DRAFT_1195665 [Mycena rosella]